MKVPPQDISISDVRRAQRNTFWNIGNEVLYRLCRERPMHRERNEIAAKVWLIGRSYAASIERLKRSDSRAEDFIIDELVPHLRQSNIDSWIDSIPRHVTSFAAVRAAAIEIHGRVLRVLSSILDRDA